MSDRPTKLVAFDLDGTLLHGDTVLEAIARPLGHLDAVREFEKLRVTDIDEIKAAREKVAGLYEASTLPELHPHLASMRFAPGAHEGMSLLKRHGFKIAIISITWEFAVEWFANQFGADYFVGTGLSHDGKITHFWPSDKAVWLKSLADRLGTPMKEVAAVGDSNGDLHMLRAVGHPYWVGSHLPTDLTAAHHPTGDIERIAQDIVAVSGR
jgi:HAD superfamily phosphoserine phosphatase-like hydrolase